jgi:hypothetical protein
MRQARFREVGQLLEGSTVKYRGVPIGRVERIELERGGGAVIVTMSVDGEIPLPPDPAVILAPESMFGDWQAEIVTRGTFPSYAFTEATEQGMMPGYSLPDMSRLTAVADEIARNLATISTRFEEAFTTETADNIRIAIENIQEVSSELATLVGSQQAALEEVARNLERTSEAAGQAAVTMQRVRGGRAFDRRRQADEHRRERGTRDGAHGLARLDSGGHQQRAAQHRDQRGQHIQECERDCRWHCARRRDSRPVHARHHAVLLAHLDEPRDAGAAARHPRESPQIHQPDNFLSAA